MNRSTNRVKNRTIFQAGTRMQRTPLQLEVNRLVQDMFEDWSAKSVSGKNIMARASRLEAQPQDGKTAGLPNEPLDAKEER